MTTQIRVLADTFTERRSLMGATVAWISVVHLLLVEQIVAAASGSPYSFARGNISDLGEPRCAPGDLCANAFRLMNVSFMLTGILMAAGAILFLRTRRISVVATALYVVAGVLVLGIGVVPQNVDLKLHQAIALAALLFVNIAPICATVRLGRSKADTAVLAAVGVLFVVGCVGLYAYSSGNGLGIGLGTTERMAAYAPLLSTTLLGWRLRYAEPARSIRDTTGGPS